MHTPYIHSLARDIDSLRDLETYLEKHNLGLAINLEAPATELLKASLPDWKKDGPQGCILLFALQIITDRLDPNSPVGKAIVRAPGEPVLSHFIAGMCSPFSFELSGVMAKDQLIYVIDRKIAEAA